ncbi:MAG: restriction endonuclease subunit S [Undibacterium sp.]|nr:restriction endonuclease subunit S [Undibacterium sp.]
MEVKPGYKQTEVGVIPEDWEVKCLGELGNVVRGGSPRPAGDARYFNGNFIPWLTVGSLTNIPTDQLFVTDTATKLTEKGSQLSRTLQDGTLVIVNSGARTLGVSKVLAITCCANDGIAALVSQSAGEKRFLCFFLNSQIRRLREVVAAGNDQLNLNTGRIALIAVPFPKETEQRAIAMALSDVDALLGGLDSLIAKKKGLKVAAMQQLLTGQTRLPGFSGEWEVKRLGEVVQIRKGQLITSTTLLPGDIPVIAGGKQPAYFHASANRFGRTITISASGASAGYVALYDAPIFASDCSTISESEFYCLDFVFYHLLCKQQVIYKAQTGGAQPHIHAKDLNPILFAFPELQEQTAIAAILSDMDTELAALQARRTKTQALKQAMMQELLTGRTRLI